MPEDGALAADGHEHPAVQAQPRARPPTDPEHLAEEIRITVLHETAHYFGLDEDDLEALGLD